MKSLKKWFKGFHPSAAKTHLKMSISRSKSQQGKCVAQIKSLEREVAMFLKEHREDKARIKAEQYNQVVNMDKAYDLLSVWCELVATRIKFLEKTEVCPQDMCCVLMSIIYCQGRCDVPELDQVKEQFEYLYGSEWIRMAQENRINEVDPNLVVYFSVQPPRRWEITQILVSLAAKFRIDWQPQPGDVDGDGGSKLPPPPAGLLADIPHAVGGGHPQVVVPGQSNHISVTVPANYQPGTPTMTLELVGGRQIVVNVPANTMPGQQMLIPISAVDPGAAAAPLAQAAPSAPSAPIQPVYHNPPAEAPRGPIVAAPDSPLTAPSAPSAPVMAVHQPSVPAPAAIPAAEASDGDKWSDLFGWLLRDGRGQFDDRVKTDIFLGSVEYAAIFFFAPGNAASDARVSAVHDALERFKGVKCEVIGIHTGMTCKDSDFSGLKFCTVPAEEPKRLEMWDENKDMVKVGDIVLLDRDREVVTPMAGENLLQDPQLRHFPWRDGVPVQDAANVSGGASSAPAARNAPAVDEYDDLLSRFEKLKK